MTKDDICAICEVHPNLNCTALYLFGEIYELVKHMCKQSSVNHKYVLDIVHDKLVVFEKQVLDMVVSNAKKKGDGQ